MNPTVVADGVLQRSNNSPFRQLLQAWTVRTLGDGCFWSNPNPRLERPKRCVGLSGGIGCPTPCGADQDSCIYKQYMLFVQFGLKKSDVGEEGRCQWKKTVLEESVEDKTRKRRTRGGMKIEQEKEIYERGYIETLNLQRHDRSVGISY